MVNDLKNETGRTMPAQSPVAPTVAAETSTGTRTKDPVTTSSAIEAVPAQMAAGSGPSPVAEVTPGLTPTASACAPVMSQPVPGPPMVDAATDEERAILHVLRLVDRVISPGTLSPVERAFIAGAKVMFDQLSSECDAMLKRKVSDLTRSLANPGETPVSAGKGLVQQPTPGASPSSSGTRKRSGRVKATKPKIDPKP